MIKTSVNMQDLRKRIYAKAKADKHHRFWGLYVHICKIEILREAYKMAKKNKGAPGSDGVTFEMIEQEGLEDFLAGIQRDLISGEYVPTRNRRKVLRGFCQRCNTSNGIR